MQSYAQIPQRDMKRVQIAPYVDGAMRGLVVFAFLGLGVGGFVVPALGLAYHETAQVTASGISALLGLVTVLVWGHRHQP